jgi:hypothetical protein
MSDNFRQTYAALKDFLARHPEIEIGDSVTSIPEEVRAEFYGRFNAVRNAFVEVQFPQYLDRAAILLEKYRKAEENLTGLLSWEDDPIIARLQRFLRDPMDSLTRELFDPLFDLLKGRESIESFMEKASAGIEALFPAVFRSGYEKWAVLSLAKMCEAEKAFRVDVRSLNPGERAKSAAQAPFEEVPAPRESASFFFSQNRNAIFAVPDFIFSSSMSKGFIGIRTEHREGLYNAWSASPERAWYPVDTDLSILLEDLTLVYVAEQAESIALIADAAKFCRPDLILWCIDTQSLSQEEALQKMTRVDSRIKPPKGSYIIANTGWPGSDSTENSLPAIGGEQSEGIHLLTVGYEESRLMPVVETLINAKGLS